MKKTIALLMCAVLMLLPAAQAEAAGGWMDWLTDAAEEAKEFFGEVGDGLSEAWNGAGGVAGEVGDALKDAWSEAGELAGEVGDALKEAWSEAGGLAGEVGDALMGAWSDAKDFWREVSPVIGGLWDRFTQAADEYAVKIRGWITGKEDATQEELMDSVRELARRAGLPEEDAGAVWEEIVSFAKDKAIEVGTAARLALVYLAGTVYSGREITRDDMLREMENWLESTGIDSDEQAETALAGLDG